jgi:hypothetical protein
MRPPSAETATPDREASVAGPQQRPPLLDFAARSGQGWGAVARGPRRSARHEIMNMIPAGATRPHSEATADFGRGAGSPKWGRPFAQVVRNRRWGWTGG